VVAENYHGNRFMLSFKVDVILCVHR